MNGKSNQSAAIILAAGKGTRMKSDTSKVLHEIASRPMICHVMDAANKAGCDPLVVVTAPHMDDVQATATEAYEECRFAIQEEQHGTAHAVISAKDVLRDHDGHVLVLFGDSPLMQSGTFEAMQRKLNENANTAIVVLGFQMENTPPYGRLIMNENGELERIVEAKDATEEELAVTWVNSGVMAIRGTLVWDVLEAIGNDNAQEEYYLTDAIAIARDKGFTCQVVEGNIKEVMGVNSRIDLAHAEKVMQQRLRKRAMKDGVTMMDPDTVFLAANTEFGKDVVIQPNVFIGPGVVVGDNVELRAFSHIEGAVIGNDTFVGPFARIRPGTGIGDDCKIGNFVELKKAQIEKGTKISHLSYIGDAHIGEDANIGAGTITCNYDGYNKYHTEIGAESFIGSNTALVAPVIVGRGAIIGAGSVVTENVDADALAVARSRQEEKGNWAKAFREKQNKDAS